MDKLLCQVCGCPATDPETGRIPWLLTKTVFEVTGNDSGRTNAPPTCRSCIAKALEECPMLQDNATLHTVISAASVGVLANLYETGVFSEQPVLARHNVFIAWDAHRYHASALATSQVVELHGMKPVTLNGSTPTCQRGHGSTPPGEKWPPRITSLNTGSRRSLR